MKPVVALVGRPNVGKSALFNRLAQRQAAIVEDIPGVTRDRIYADTEWQGREFTLVDTGGLTFTGREDMSQLVRCQAETAIAEADVIVLVVDGRQGVMPDDLQVAELLRRAKAPTILAVNKGEAKTADTAALEFYALGLAEPRVVSALHGLGTGDLLDAIVAELPAGTATEEKLAGPATRVAVVGRPNVGKSSLINRLVGQDRMIVSAEAGTTRDAVDIACTLDGRDYVFVDTAGLRRRSRVEAGVERYSALRALRAVSRAQVVVLLLDATSGIADQDKKIVNYIDEAGRGLVLAVNKWDLMDGQSGTQEKHLEEIRWQLAFVQYAPVTFISALTGQGVPALLGAVDRVAVEHGRTLGTSVLNDIVQQAVAMHPPATEKGRALKIYYVTQVGTRPPRVACFVNEPSRVTAGYRRYLEGRLRQAFGLEGTPLILQFRPRR
ncbi:MAG TPA: ribosome biogenesis GTPase Der [Clostridiales bacterium UBA8153]|nr:ribosome biogenesis GTPase Der [Clostridiales bacterium UBA8153]